jgi:CheY-like chemotaxis protein
MAKIMFIDDDALTLQTLKKSAELLGHQALLASSGKQAYDLLSQDLPELILTDMRLPDMDGPTVIGTLKLDERLKEIPVVVLSASPEVDAVAVVRTAGAEEFLSKPVRLQTLQDVIARYTSG